MEKQIKGAHTVSAEKPSPPAHPHYGHRERVRNLFLRSGLDGFSDHNVLELLLFYTIPKADTNLIAHNLIDRFGSLKGVLDASVENLCDVKGLGMYTATFLTILPQLARRYCTEETPETALFDSSDTAAVREYLCSRFVGESRECVYLLLFSSGGQMQGCVKVTTGTSSQVNLNERSILETAFRTGASSIILAHNHPGGVAAPSTDDVATTKELVEMFARCGIRLLDHVIVTETESFSMANHPRFHKMFDLQEE